MESVQVKDYMNYYPVTFTPEMNVEEAAMRFLKTKQIGGPVIDKANRLVGFISETDILAKMIESIYFNQHFTNVSGLMRTDVLSVKPYDSVVELGQKMLQKKPKVYPVVDDEGNLMGTICRSDVLLAIDKHLRAGEKTGGA